MVTATIASEEAALVNHLETVFSGQKIIGTSGDAEHTINAPKVGVNVVIPNKDAYSELKTENLVFTVDADTLIHHPRQGGNTLLKVLQEKIPELTTHVQFDSQEEHAVALKKKAKEFITLGADIPAYVLEADVFKPELAEAWYGAKGHALSIDKSPSRISITIKEPWVSMQTSLGKGEEAKKQLEADEANIKSRVELIKASIAERAAIKKGFIDKKTKKVIDEAGYTALKEKASKLIIETSSGEFNASEGYSTPAQISIQIFSPEQKLAIADNDKFMALPEDKKKEIAAANLLEEFAPDQLGKILGRAILYAGDTAKDIFPRVAGSEDVKTAIIKPLIRLKMANLGNTKLAADIDAFINDDSFKAADWHKPRSQQAERKSRPIITKEAGKPLEISITLPEGIADDIIHAVAKRLPPLPSVTSTLSDTLSEAQPKAASLVESALVSLGLKAPGESYAQQVKEQAQAQGAGFKRGA